MTVRAFALTAALIRRNFRRHLPSPGLPPGGRVLDIGCGTGSTALRLARQDCAVVGVDSSAVMVARARAKLAAGRLALRGEACRLSRGPVVAHDSPWNVCRMGAAG
jgi:release factor glutamine methyltransferase